MLFQEEGISSFGPKNLGSLYDVWEMPDSNSATSGALQNHHISHALIDFKKYFKNGYRTGVPVALESSNSGKDF